MLPWSRLHFLRGPARSRCVQNETPVFPAPPPVGAGHPPTKSFNTFQRVPASAVEFDSAHAALDGLSAEWRPRPVPSKWPPRTGPILLDKGLIRSFAASHGGGICGMNAGAFVVGEAQVGWALWDAWGFGAGSRVERREGGILGCSETEIKLLYDIITFSILILLIFDIITIFSSRYVSLSPCASLDVYDHFAIGFLPWLRGEPSPHSPQRVRDRDRQQPGHAGLGRPPGGPPGVDPPDRQAVRHPAPSQAPCWFFGMRRPVAIAVLVCLALLSGAKISMSICR